MIVVLPAGAAADWFAIAGILSWKGLPACVPYSNLLVRSTGFWESITRRPSPLLEPVTRPGKVLTAAGGKRSQLDLQQQATAARHQAGQHWWAWNNHIARTTPAARTWQQYLADVANPAKKFGLRQAKERFEAQPRVMAMLAHNSFPAVTDTFDPYALDEYQAGEAVYVALHWQQALTGDAFVTADGRLLAPASTTIADRLRYLDEATRIIHTVTPDQYVVAAKASKTP